MNFLRRHEKEGLKLAESVNVAVIGSGYWGRKVLSEYTRLSSINPKVHLLMVCDLKGENLKSCSEAFHLSDEKLTDDYSTVLSSEAINAVHICTPNETHNQICMEALNAGKNVLLEKPMALHAKSAWELVRMAEHKHLILQVGHIFRFNNALKMMRDLMVQNYLGELYYLKLQWTTLCPSPLGRDIIFDLGPHPVDILNFLLSKWPETVTCKAKAYRRKTLEELAYATLEFDQKLIAHIELSWLEPGKARQVTIIGSERAATVDCLEQTIQVNENGDKESLNLNVVKNNTIFDEVSHFAESIITGKNSRNPGMVGAGNVAVLENMKKSLETGATVKNDLRDGSQKNA
jgi:predicted dehydrogenase